MISNRKITWIKSSEVHLGKTSMFCHLSSRIHGGFSFSSVYLHTVPISQYVCGKQWRPIRKLRSCASLECLGSFTGGGRQEFARRNVQNANSCIAASICAFVSRGQGLRALIIKTRAISSNSAMGLSPSSGFPSSANLSVHTRSDHVASNVCHFT